MKLIIAMTMLASLSAFAQRGMEGVFQCSDGTYVAVDMFERRNLEIILGSELKNGLFFPDGSLDPRAATFFYDGRYLSVLTQEVIRNAFTAAIGHAREGVFYPSQFQGMLVTFKDGKEVRVLKKNDELEVTLYDSQAQQVVARASAKGCR